MPSPVLVVQHQDSCPPALMGTWLAEAGAAVRVLRPYAGDRLPGDLADHAGLLVLGGSMGANDDASVPWLEPTKRLLCAAARDGVPALGICLGHQLAAVALGGVVRPDARGRTAGVQQVGWRDAAGADPLVGPLTATDTLAVQWNHDSVARLPLGSLELARRADGQLQAAQFAPTVWGVQWHPEADAGIVAVWAARERSLSLAPAPEPTRGDDTAADPAPAPAAGAARTTSPVATDDGNLDTAIAGVAGQSKRLERTWRPLAQRFAALCSTRTGLVERLPAGESSQGAARRF